MTRNKNIFSSIAPAIIMAALFLAKTAEAQSIDYSDASNWVGRGLTNGVLNVHNADILLLPGTGSCDEGASNGTIAQAKTASSQLESTLAGNNNMRIREFLNVYTPVYRHACMTGSMNMEGQGLTDFLEAFDYYWENYNKGERPFFLLGFSQGARMAWNATLNRINSNEEMRKFHILTYALGTPGRPNSSAANTAFSQTPTDLNKVIDFAPYNETSTNIGFAAANNQRITNPLSWTTDDTYEACTVDGVNRCNGNQILGAQVDYTKRVLLVRLNPSASPQPTEFSGMGYHGQEYIWFASSIAQNMKDRIAAWNEVYGNTVPSSSSSENTPSSSSSETTPILNRDNSHILGALCTGVACYAPTYYNLKGEPLGTQKPATPGVYIVKNSRTKQTQKIVIK